MHPISVLDDSFEQAELLAGHWLPLTADNYVRRNPQQVAKACTEVAYAFSVADQMRALVHRRPPFRGRGLPIGWG